MNPDTATLKSTAIDRVVAALESHNIEAVVVVGSQKIVPDLTAALARIDDVVFPWEDARVEEQLGVHTKLQRILIICGEWMAGRTTVILVREPVGI